MNECADLETELWEEFNKKIWHMNNEHRIKRQEMEKRGRRHATGRTEARRERET